VPSALSDSKPWYQSKTVWVNVISAIIAIVMALAGQDFIKNNPQLVSLAVLVLAVLNAVLRWVTTLPLSVSIWLLAAALFFGGGASALAAPDDTAILVDGAIASQYIVTIDGKGGVTLVPLARVVRPGPAPTPGPGPTPTPLTDRAKVVMAAAQKVTGDTDRAGTATGLAEMYRQLAAVVDANPTITPASLLTALTTANNTFLASRSVLTQWQPVRDVMGTYWTGLQAQGAPVASYSTLLKESAAGLDASAPNAATGKGINPDMLKLIMQIIMLIMQLLVPQPVPVH
jgi:hypothetical protein